MRSLLLFCALLVSFVAADEPSVWNTPEYPDCSQVVLIEGEDGRRGSGVLVDGSGIDGVVLTARHVVEGAKVGWLVTYQGGEQSKDCSVMHKSSKEYDVATLRVWVPAGLVPARVATQPVRHRDRIVVVSSRGRLLTRETASLARPRASVTTTPNKLYADVEVQPGDSGAPVFNEAGEVVGIVSGGWFWFGDEDNFKTWPLRAAGVKQIRRLLDKK